MRIITEPASPGIVEAMRTPGAKEWRDLESVGAHGGGFASVSVGKMGFDDYTEILVARDFGISVPPDAEIIGVIFTVRARASTGKASIANPGIAYPGGRLSLIPHGASILSGAYSDLSFYVGPENINEFGIPIAPSPDLVRSAISSAEFGFVFEVKSLSDGADPNIDSIEASVVYDVPDDVENRIEKLEEFVTALEARITLLEEGAH